VTQIIDNLLKFCANVAPKYWTHDSLRGEKIKLVVAKIYRYLSMSFFSEKPSNSAPWEKLRNLKWILVEWDNEPVFVRPTEIFEELPGTFPGYFYKLPCDWFEFGKYVPKKGGEHERKNKKLQEIKRFLLVLIFRARTLPVFI
jgi:hypothetical protein